MTNHFPKTFIIYASTINVEVLLLLYLLTPDNVRCWLVENLAKLLYIIALLCVQISKLLTKCKIPIKAAWALVSTTAYQNVLALHLGSRVQL